MVEGVYASDCRFRDLLPLVLSGSAFIKNVRSVRIAFLLLCPVVIWSFCRNQNEPHL